MSTPSPRLASGISLSRLHAPLRPRTKRTVPICAVSVAAWLACPATAQTSAIWSGADGLWTDGSLWDSAPLFPADAQPGLEDTWNARISAGSVSLDNALTIQRLTLEGGTLSLQQSGPLGVAAGFDWSGGTLFGSTSSPLQIASPAISTWSGDLSVSAALVSNAGALTLAEGSNVSVSGASYGENTGLLNEVGGVLTLAGTGSWRSDWFGEGPIPAGLRNEGTLNKNGTGTFTVGGFTDFSGGPIPFQNSGTVNIHEGTLLSEADVHSTGTWNIAESARLVVTDVTSTSASLIQGAGEVEYRGNSVVEGVHAVTGTTRAQGGVAFNTTGPTSFTDLVIEAGGNVSGSAALTVTENLHWAGSISGSSNAQTLALAAGASGVVPSGGTVILDNRTFNNAGSLEWTGAEVPGASNLLITHNTAFNNLAGGTFTATGSSRGTIALSIPGSFTPGTFNNAGTFIKQGDGTTTQLAWDFANTGLVSVDQGRLEIASASNAGGLFEVATGSTLSLTRKSSTLDGGILNRPYAGSYDLGSGSTLELGPGNLSTAASFPSGTGTLALGRLFSDSLLITRNDAPVSLLRFVGLTGFIPPSGTFTAANAELVPNGILAPSGARVRLTGGLAWSGGTVGGQGPFPAGSGGTLELAAGSSSILSGTGAVENGTLQIDGALAMLPGSQLRVGANGIVLNNAGLTVGDGASIVLSPSTTVPHDATIRGGSLTTTGTGVLRVGRGRNVIGGESYGTLDGVAFSGTAELTENLSSLRLLNGSSVTGTVRFTAANAANYTAFEVHQSGTLNDIRMEDTTPLGNSSAAFVIIGNRSVTLGPDAELIRIRSVSGDFINQSTGAIIETGAAHLINEGRIATDGTGRFTNISAFASFENRGVLEVTGGANMDVDRSFTQTAGTILIGAGSSFVLSNPPSRPSTQTLTITGGTLGGSGTFSGNLILNGGTVAPGMSPGLLSISGNLTATDGTLSFEIGGSQRGSQYDALNITGNLDLGPGAELELLFVGGTLLPTDVLTLVSATGISGGFLNVANGQRLATLDGLGSFLVHYGAGSLFGAGNVVLTDFIGAIPEPASVTLFVGGVALLACLLRRRSKA